MYLNLCLGLVTELEEKEERGRGKRAELKAREGIMLHVPVLAFSYPLLMIMS